MRESLTVLAILLIVVLTTALVGPYFVNWNAHRGEIEARLSDWLGAEVSVNGPIDVKLLPRPIFRLQDVTVAGRSPRDGKVSAERVDVELALTAMLRGEIRFVEADLTQPRVTLTVADDRSIVLPRFVGSDPDRVSLAHVGVHEGVLVLLSEDGAPTFTATGLNGEGEAGSLLGPFKFSGQVDTPRGALGFRLATGALDAGKLRLKATVEALSGWPKTDVDGTLSINAAANAASSLGFEGSVDAVGAVPLAGTTAVVPWRLATRVHAEPGLLDASALELRVGADGRALVATGTGHADVAPPTARLTLRARQADLARFPVALGGGDTQPGPGEAGAPGQAPTLADEIAAVRALATDPDAFGWVPLPITVDYGVDTVTMGRQTLTNLAGTVTLASGKPLVGRVEVGAPDGSHLMLDGTFEPGPAAVFKGRAEAATRDLGRLASGFAADPPDMAAWLGHALPVTAFGFKGALDLSGVGFAAHDVELSLDRSTFAGTITLTRTVGQDRARLFADLTSEALDLDALPDWGDTAAAAGGLDLALTLSARALRLARSDTGSVTAGRIDLRLNKAGAVVTLDRLSLADLGGATADITGRSDGRTAHAEGRLDARKLRDVLNLVHRLAPGVATDQLLARAEDLSPGLFSIVADAARGPEGAWEPRALTLDGTAAGTRLALRLKSDEAARAGGGYDASVRLDAPESGALLRQLGLPTLAATAIGRGHVEAKARVTGRFATAASVSANLGDVVLTADGADGGPEGMRARLAVKGSNVAPLLRGLTLAFPGVGAVWPLDAVADLALRDRTVTMRGLTGHLIGTAFGGDLAYRLPDPVGATDPGQPLALTGSLTVDRLPLPLLVGLALGPLPPPRAGALWPDAPFAPGFLHLPRADLAVTAAVLPLNDGATARNATLGLQLRPGVVTLSSLSARLNEGQVGADLTFRRDGAAASVNGHVDWLNLPVASPSFGGRSRGALDVAGTGMTVAALVASLAGSGTVQVEDARLPRLDASAIARVVKASDAAASLDDFDVKQAVTDELDHGALSLGGVGTPVTVAAGVLRGEPIRVKGPTAQSQTVASLDLKSLALSLKSTVTLLSLPKDWVGSPPQVSVSWAGPFLAPTRDIDATSLINGIASRAIARDQAKIEAFQDDIRERAFFASRLRSIEAEQRERARAEDEAKLQKLLQALPVSPKLPEFAQPPGRPVPRPLDLTHPRAVP